MAGTIAGSRGHAWFRAGVRRRVAHRLVIVTLTVLVNGCASSSQLTPAQPSAITQQLAIRSLERALGQLDTTRFTDRKISLDLFAQQTSAQAFAKEFVTTWLEARGVRVTSAPQDLKLRVIVPVLVPIEGRRFSGFHRFWFPWSAFPLRRFLCSSGFATAA